MSLKKVKKILKPFAQLISKALVRVILFVNFNLFHSKRNLLPVLFANLCFGDSLVYKINPELLKYHIADPDSMPGNLFVWAGEWDRDTIPIEEHEKFVMIRELFVENKDYRDTQFYSLAVERMKDGTPLKRGDLILDSFENIVLYFEKHKKIFEEIKTRGFDLNLAPEVGVAVARDGQLLHFRQGHHTLAIAKILGVENVIVRIRAVHSIWLMNQLRSGSRVNLLESVRKGFKELQE
ncbi:MAG: hypothetical protein PHG41_00395 [Actinomycetota bacterium]|nr:hypothetical protein [Actinomycetota bacterium]